MSSSQNFLLCALLCAAVGICLLASGASAAEITTLTIVEQAGADRANEPIRMGVPLAQGVAKEVGELGLTDAAGKPIPCQFLPVMRWPQDDSLRWVHAIFQASVPAKGTTTVKLVKDVPVAGPASAAKVEVVGGKDSVVVTNGPVKLAIKGANFNLFDGAWFDPTGKFGPETQLVKPGGEGIVATIDGKACKPAGDSKLEVEEKGPLAAVIKVSGKLAGEGVSPFDYVCRIHVFAGSPVVKVDFSYTDSSGKAAADKVSMSDLSVVLPVAGAKASVGGEDKVYSGKSARIVAKTSDLSEITVDGAAAGTAKGKSTKPLSIGWADVSGSDAGVAVGVRWFWQMFPKAMEAGNGKLRAALFAKEVDKPMDVYMGQGRTHYLTFLFHGKADDKTLAGFFAGTQMPLRALATPKYYCRDTAAFGKIADADPSIYPADVQAAEKRYDELLKQSADRIVAKIDGASYNGVTMDSYGYLAWGDLFHHASESGVTDPWNIMWESNYYDFPWACGLQFARTGDLTYLDIMDRNGLNLADVFMCKWAPNPEFRGACRYSPPDNFVGMNGKPYFSVEFNHHKAMSILARYYLLGDLRAKDDFLLALNNAMTAPEQRWRQSRGNGARLATLYSGYLLNHDPKILDRMKATVAAAVKAKGDPNGSFSDQGNSGWFMMGIAAEGLSYYYWLTGDSGTFETIQAIEDFLIPHIGKPKGADDGFGKKLAYAPNNEITTDQTFALGLLYRQTGDEKYKKAALELFKLNEVEVRPKGFGQEWRNAAYSWYYLSNVGAKKDAPMAAK